MRAVVIIFIIFSLLVVGVMLWADYVEYKETRPPECTPVEVEEPTTEPPPEPEVIKVHYLLTDAERDLVERVVMAEAGAEPYEGQMAVAQCILNACILEKMRPLQLVREYQYATARPDPTDAVKMAVGAVFDKGDKVIDPEVKYFYAPARVVSAWHESQVYACTIGGHRFFKEASSRG